MTTYVPIPSVLTDQIITRCGERAADYDRESSLFAEDVEELRRTGYLLLPIPRELGGHGMSLAEVCQEQRRLAYRAPTAALAAVSPLAWAGVAADLRREGDTSLQWVLEDGARGEVFACGHEEEGNDLPLLYSTTVAERVVGGYRLRGRKLCSGLTPGWSRLAVHAIDVTSPAEPLVVHGFLPRDAPGYRIEPTRDPPAAGAPDSVVLEGAVVPDAYVARVLPPGFGGADRFSACVIAWVELVTGNLYLGMARRALDLAVERATTQTSVSLANRSMAFHPGVQQAVAQMVLCVDTAVSHVDRVADDWVNGANHARVWTGKLLAARYVAATAAKTVAELALDTTSTTGSAPPEELGRLYRQLRSGPLPPANLQLVHEVVGKTALGVLGEQPRWG